MKNLKLIITILFLTVTSSYSYAQEYKLGEKTVTKIFGTPGKSKTDLFSNINKWISINYNSAKSVIQMDDEKSGTIIVKGINKVTYKNVLKSLHPKNKYIPEYYTTEFNHLMEIDIKDNKYRIIYKITGIASRDYGANDMIFNCINFTGTNEKAITEYNEYIDKLLKEGLVGKKKRENMESRTKPLFNSLNSSILNDIKMTMKSVKQSVDAKTDNW